MVLKKMVNDKAVIIDIVKEKSLQDKMSDHCLDHYHKKIYSIFIELYQITSKTWKDKRYLNVEKRIKNFREFSDGYIDFN